MRRCSRAARCLLEILPFRQTDGGPQWLASECTLDGGIKQSGKLISRSELTVKVLSIVDTYKVLYLRDLPKPAKHLSFDPSGSYIAASCTDGVVYVYSLSTEEPQLIRKVDGLIRSLEIESESSSRAVWHPDGRAFAAPTATRDIQVVSSGDGQRQRAFSGGHLGNVTSLAWSPNGALLITAASDGKILLWDTKTQKTLARYVNSETEIDNGINIDRGDVCRYDYSGVINMAWHPTENIVSFVTSDGELFIYERFLQPDTLPLFEEPLQPAPFIRDPHVETSGNASKNLDTGFKDTSYSRARRTGTPDSLDDILGPESGDGGLDFVSDDDGGGYADGINGFGKRSNGHLDTIDRFDSKRRATSDVWRPRVHQSFQPGSTPWQGDRKYLCRSYRSRRVLEANCKLGLNLTGFVWTVDQTTHNTVTVEFYDREFHRDFHFTDPYLYDKACLSMLPMTRNWKQWVLTDDR